MRRWFFLVPAVVLAAGCFPDSKGEQLWEFVEEQAAWDDSIVARLDGSAQSQPIVIANLRAQINQLCAMIQTLDEGKKFPKLDCAAEFPTGGPGDVAGSPTPPKWPR